MADGTESEQAAVVVNGNPPQLTKSARKKLLKQERQAARKAERKVAEKERRRADIERRRREWEESLAAAPSEEAREEMLAARRETRLERVGKRVEERGARAERLRRAAEGAGQKVVLDLEFADLMRPNELHSLTQQIMYCYAVNGRSATPAHLWLTGCSGELGTQVQRIPGFDKWIIEKESKPYLEAFADCKENLVYLTADAETVLDDLDMSKIYIIGGLVDRNRWKGITQKKAVDQGIQSARLPIGNYLKMSSSQVPVFTYSVAWPKVLASEDFGGLYSEYKLTGSPCALLMQVLTVNQVFEIMQKFVETKDWETAFFHVIPQRKRGEAGAAEDEVEASMGDDATLEGTTNGDHPEGDVDKCSDEEVDDDDGADEEDGVAKKRHCVRSENGKS